MTAALARRFARVVALDVAPSMLERARVHLADADNVVFVLGDGTDLGVVADASVDLVFSYIVLQHIPDPAITERCIRDMGRVLRPGGHAWFQCNNLPRRLRERLVPASCRRVGRRLLDALRGRVDPAAAPPDAEADAAVDARARTGAPVGDGDERFGAGADAGSPGGPTGLDHPAWVGSRLSLGRIRRALERGGLDLLRTEGERTQYLWVLARRRPG